MYSITVTERGKQPERIELDKAEIVLGRAYGNDIILARSSVSKRHVRIVVTEDRFMVYDLQSTNGTSVSGHKISAPAEVKSGDTIVVGDFRILLKHEGAGVPRPSVSEYVIGPPISPSGSMPSLTGSHAQVMPRDIETGSHLPATGFGKDVTTTRITSVHSALGEGITVGVPSMAAVNKTSLSTPASSASVDQDRLAGDAPNRRKRIRIQRQPAVFGPLHRPEGAAFAEVYAAALNGALLRVSLTDLPLAYPTRQEDVLRFSPLVAKAVDLATPADFDSDERAALAPLLLAELLGLGPLELLLNATEATEVHLHAAGEIFERKADSSLRRATVEIGRPETALLAFRRLASAAHVGNGGSAHILLDGFPTVVVNSANASEGGAASITRAPRSMGDIRAAFRASNPDAIIAWLHEALRSRANVVVSSPNRSLATSFIHGLLGESGDRIVIVEEIPSSTLRGFNVLRLECNTNSLNSDLQRAFMLRPDYAIIDPLVEKDVAIWLAGPTGFAVSTLVAVAARSSADAISSLAFAAAEHCAAESAAVHDRLASRIDLLIHVDADANGLFVVSMSELTHAPHQRFAREQLYGPNGVCNLRPLRFLSES
ncbi:MAG: FHA domain-containing protein [Deltaproteobacteria bacterium]|nr:FHA domain-containing protein [Deltaproteobacteria bacterium]